MNPKKIQYMYKYIALIISLIVINNALSFTPDTPTIIYFGLIAFASLIGLYSKVINVNVYLILLIIASIISLITNEIPDYFNAPLRLFIFVTGLLLLSPLITTANFIIIRIYLFRFINIALFGIIILSIIGKFSGIYPGIGRTRLFQGITVHSMMLGPIAAIVMLLSISELLKHQLKRLYRYFFVFLFFISFIALLLASSRSAILGAIFSIVLFLFKYYRASISRLLSVFILIVLFLTASSSLWMGLTERIQQKNDSAVNQGGILSSREVQWNYRIEEFKSSPVIGIGFASIKKGLMDKKTGVIEPTSSWLAIFSMTGILGGVSFLLLVSSNLIRLFKAKKNKLNTSLLLGLLGFFILHWFAEGYIFAAGGFLFFYSWLLLGIIDINILLQNRNPKPDKALDIIQNKSLKDLNMNNLR